MNKQQTENLLYVVALCAQRLPDTAPLRIARDLAKLQRLAVTLRKRYEAECSYGWANAEKYTRDTERHEVKAVVIASSLGLKTELQRDPRGCAIKLFIAEREEVLF